MSEITYKIFHERTAENIKFEIQRLYDILLFDNNKNLDKMIEQNNLPWRDRENTSLFSSFFNMSKPEPPLPITTPGRETKT